MGLQEALIQICNESIDLTNDWYSWREIDKTKLPSGISLSEGNQYQKNIALKVALNQLWLRETDITMQEELIKYYISTWGGIHSNSRDTIARYASHHPDRLISKGKAGVASWSKALVVRDPILYAIFDARVAVSLNSIQIIYAIDGKALFPLLPSRNTTIVSANKRIKEIANSDAWSKRKSADFYTSYLALLRDVASVCKTNISTVEMLLFSKAIDLARRII